MTAESELLTRITDMPFHRMFRTFGSPVTVPLEISFALTYKCANRCRTCASITKANGPEMSADDYTAVFRRVSFSPLSITLTGGEPFLRDDFTAIASSACAGLRPSFVFIETCGDLHEYVSAAVRELAGAFPASHFVVRLPLDGLQEKMDWMRGGASDSFEYFLRTFKTLKSLGAPNLSLVLGVPVSKYNVKEAPALLREAFWLSPDAVALEFTGRLNALGAPDSAAPDPAETPPLLDLYRKLSSENKPRKGASRALSALYLRRAATAVRAMSGAGAGRCFAGFASLYVDPSGSVMDCPGAARELGALTENDYNLERIIDSERARETRRMIASGKCDCPMLQGPVFSNVFLTPAGCARIAAAVI